jgi:TonB-dependent SusC/RagA subfamily outer membrane receptor
MRKTSRSMVVLLLLGSPACAHDRILAPGIAPGPASAELAMGQGRVFRTNGGVVLPLLRTGCAGVAPVALPLYVVDGVTLENLDDIDAGDIEKIEVLRGTEAAALYGVRGANGVVFVTTRARRSTAAP